jgi:hypothetical protein
VGKPEGKSPLEIPRRKWVDNIKMDLTEIGWDGMDLIDLAQDRDQWRVFFCEHGNETSGSIKCREQCHYFLHLFGDIVQIPLKATYYFRSVKYNANSNLENTDCLKY